METGRWCFSCEAWICNQQQFHSDDFNNFWEAHHLSAAHKIAAEKYTGPTEGEWDGLTIAATLLEGSQFEFRDVARCLRKYGYTDKLYVIDNTYFAVYSRMDSAVKALSSQTYCNGVPIKLRPKFDWAAKTPPVDISKIELSSEGSWEEQARQLAIVLRLPDSIAPEEKKALDKKIDQLCDDVQNTLLGFFTNVQCFVYGSRLTGLAGVDSDIDLFAQLDMRNTEFEDCEEFTPEVNMDVLKKCDRQLRRKPHLFANIMSIYQARIPVTHTLHLPTMIECDVTCKNMLGVHNSRFLAFLCSLDQRIFSLFLILKQWKKAHAFPMSTYNLTMLAIFYLQNLPQPFLPSIVSLKNACTTPVLENNWVCGFCTDPIEISNPIGLRALVVGFFKFLPTLDFGVDVICPLLGTTLERWKFKQPDTLPPEIQESLGVVPDLPLQTEKPMVVQDPFELNHNISKGMTHKNLVDLVSIASEVAELCETNPQLPLIDMIRFELPHQQTKKQNQSATTVVEKFWLKDFQPHPDRLQQLSLRELWFQDLNTLLRDIFTEILLFEIKGASSPDDGVHSDSDAPPAKMQRMPSTTSDSLSWSMSSPVVLVNGRKKHQPILSNGGRFVKEVITTQILIQKFYSNLAAVDERFHVGVTAELVLHQRPTFALLTVNSDGCDKDTFKTLCRYVATDLHTIVDQSLGTPYKTELETLKGLQSLPEQLEAFGGVLKDNVATQEVKVNQVQMQSNPSPRRKRNKRGAGSSANSQSSSNSSGAAGNPFLRAIERHF